MHSPSFLSLCVCVSRSFQFRFKFRGRACLYWELPNIFHSYTERERDTFDLDQHLVKTRETTFLFWRVRSNGALSLSLSFSFFLFPFKFRHLTDVWIATHAGVSLRAVFDSTTHTHTSSSIEMWNACLWVAKRTNRFFGVMTSFTHYHPTTHPLHPSRRHPGSCRSP